MEVVAVGALLVAGVGTSVGAVVGAEDGGNSEGLGEGAGDGIGEAVFDEFVSCRKRERTADTPKPDGSTHVVELASSQHMSYATWVQLPASERPAHGPGETSEAVALQKALFAEDAVQSTSIHVFACQL